MSLRLIYGRAGSGKSYFCLNDIKHRLEKEDIRELMLLVPEQFSFQSQKNFLKIVGEKGSVKAQVLDFKRMAHKVFNEVGGITRKHMNSSGKSMLIYHILEQKKDQLRTFNLAAKQQGFVNTVSDMISEFKRFNVTPELLTMAVNNLENNEGLKDKLLDISSIYSDFQNVLHKNYIDSDDDLTLLAEKIDIWKPLQGAEVWIDEFSSFTPQQYIIIEKLLKKCSQVNITLCAESSKGNVNDSDVFAVTSNTERRLISIAEENNISIDKPITLNKKPFYRFGDSREIGFLEEQFYSFPYKTYNVATENISIFKATNTYAEVEKAAREITRLCMDEGVRYKDIAVVTRDLNRYAKLTSVIFSEYGIPYFIDEKKDIDGNLIVVLITSVIEIFTKNWSYEAVFRYLKTGLTGISRENIDLLENYAMAVGIKGKKKWTQEEDWNIPMERQYDATELSDRNIEILQRVNEIRRSVVEPIERLYLRIKNKNLVKDTCTAVYEFLCELNIPNTIEKWIKDLEISGKLELAREYSQIWNIIMELLDQIVEVLGTEKLMLDQFVKVISIGFNEHKMGLIPPALDQVLVGGVDRLKSHDVTVLFIIGVNDGIFPSATNDEGILTDQDRAVLNAMGMELAKDTKSQAFEEQYLVYTSLTLANKCLKISYPMADFEGKSLRPSVIISRLKTIFTKLSEENDLMEAETEEEYLKLVNAPTPTFNQLISIMRKNEDGEEHSPIWKDVYNWYASNDKWQDRCSNIFSGISYTNQVKLIQAEKIRKLYGDNINYSVTRFEKYVQCPFAYYAQYGLKAKERRIFKLSAPDLGSFMHGVIDKFSKNVTETNLDWKDVNKDWCSDQVSLIVDEMIESKGAAVFNSSPRYRYLTSRLKRVLTRTMMLITEQIKRSGFSPVSYEQEFRQGAAYPPIVIELPSGEKVNIIGKIDRIDMLEREGETYIRIVDYKSGSKEFKLSDVYFGLQIQLLLYLDAVCANESEGLENPLLPGGILYFKIDDPMIKNMRNLSDEQLEIEIMKSLKMKGLLLKDVDIIKEMDREIVGNSYIIPARINKDGTLGKSSAASEEQFLALKNHVRENLARCCTEMLKGDITIKPYKKKKETACDYCIYSSVCQFDSCIKDNNYRVINELNDDEIWSKLSCKEGEE
jgi:ATP-dependent helicase/nuclease subunit B